MAKKTLLKCTQCGGDVALDLTGFMKVVAPSFGLDMTGIKYITADVVKLFKMGGHSYLCLACGAVFTKDNIEAGVSSDCKLCNKSSPVSNLVVTTSVAILCKDCLEIIKIGEDKNISDLYGSIGGSTTSKTSPLSRVLFSEITL